MSEVERLIRFAAVAKELSFSRAAMKLHVDQPWLSRQIQQLEQQLGYPLFVRTTRRVSLTKEGEHLLIHASELAAAAERAHRAIQSLSRERNGAVSLGVHASAYWIPARYATLQRFAATYPVAHVRISNSYTARLLSRLKKSAVDIVLIPAPFEFEDLEHLVVHRSAPSLLVPPGHPLAERGSVSLADLAGQEIAVTAPSLNPATHRHRYGQFLEAGAIPVVIHEGQAAMGYYARAQRLIMVSQGWPNSDEGAPADFVHLSFGEPINMIEFALLRRRESERPLVNGFWKIASETAREILNPAKNSVSERTAKFNAFVG